jgi:hypothetical protein
MADIWDKLKGELDKAGKVAQEAIDEGKLRIELFRVRQAADKNAQLLGYAVYRASKDGREPDKESYSRLMAQLAEEDAEMSRIEAELKKVDGTTTAAPPADAQPGATNSNAPPTG